MKSVFSCLIVGCALALLAGCLSEPIARTSYVVLANSAGLAPSQVAQTADRVVQATALERGFDPMGGDLPGKEPSSSKVYIHMAEHQPRLYITIHLGQHPLRVDVTEKYIRHPTSQHRRLARDLKRQFEEAGLSVVKIDPWRPDNTTSKSP
jgi:hypothetical protein